MLRLCCVHWLSLVVVSKSYSSLWCMVFSLQWLLLIQGLPNGSVSKESACHAGDVGDAGFIPGLGRAPGEGSGNPLQYSDIPVSCPKGCKESDMTSTQARCLLVQSTALEHLGSVVAADGLSCSVACGIFPDQGSNPCPCVGRRVLNYWTTREVFNFFLS